MSQFSSMICFPAKKEPNSEAESAVNFLKLLK